MLQMTPDYVALCAAVGAHPDEDAPRLMLADYLDGLDTVRLSSRKCTMCVDGKQNDMGIGDVTCNEWDCQSCMGTGLIHGPLDTSNRDRAELIRVQCELAPYPNASDTPQSRHMTPASQWVGLRKRERELLDAHADRWRKGPVCAECNPNGNRIGKTLCYLCHGTGDAGGLMRRKDAEPTDTGTWQHSIEYVRGMKRVHATMGECVKEVRHRDYPADQWGPAEYTTYYEPSDWLRDVVTYHPDMIEIWVTDREPWELPNKHGYVWFCQGSGTGGFVNELEGSIFDLLKDGTIGPASQNREVGRWSKYPTEDLARTALARGIVRWARKFI